MSFAALYVLLIPAIGYICVHKQNTLKRKAKPISGLELTYYSAFWGSIFLGVAFIIARTLTFAINANFSEPVNSFMIHLTRDVDEVVFYILIAGAFSFLYSHFFINPEEGVWHGDANTGRIWGELLAKESIIVIFLKNGKCYQGLLTEVEVSERVPLEERVVSLFVILSGIRNAKGIVDWNTSYKTPLRHYVFMSEVVNFTEYSSGATFKIGSKKTVSTVPGA